MCRNFRSIIAIAAAAVLAGIFSHNAWAQSGWSTPKTLNSYGSSDQLISNETQPHIENDGNGNWLAMWRNPDNIHYAFAHSEDTGANWSPNSFLNATSVAQTTSTGFRSSYATHTYAGNNTWLTAWIVQRYAPYPQIYQVYTSYSTNLGTTWSEPLRLDLGGETSQPLTNAFDIQLAADGAGNVLGLFTAVSGSPAARNIYLIRSTDFGQSWSDPEKLSRRAGIPLNADQVKISYAGNSTWLLISTDVAPFDDSGIIYLHKYFASTSTNLGETWTISGPILQDYSLRTTANFEFQYRDGTAVVALYNDRSFTFEASGINKADGYQVVVSTDSGATFTAPVWLEYPLKLNGDPHLSLGADAAGNWVVTADVQFNQLPPAVYSTNNPVSTWTKNTLTTGVIDQIDIAGGSAGEFVAVMQYVNTLGSVLNYDMDIASVRSTDGGVVWSSPVPVNESALTDNTQIRDSQVDLESGSNVMLSAWTASTTSFQSISSTMFSRSETKGFYWDPASELATPADTAPKLVHVGGANWIAYRLYRDISYSTDNGQNWTAPVALPSEHIASNNAGVLVRALSNGRIVRSLDGGHTWNAETQTGVSSIKQIIHTGGSSWLAVASTGSLLVSTDNAITWVSYPAPPFTIRGIAADKSGVVLATAYMYEDGPNTYDRVANTYVSRSADRGITWSPLELVHTQTRNLSGSGVSFTGYPQPLWLGGDQWAVFPKNVLASRPVPLDRDRIRFVDIFYIESTDGAANWGTPEQVIARSGNDLGVYGSDYAVMSNVVTVAYEVAEFPHWYEGDILYTNKIIRGTTSATDWAIYE